MERLIKLEKDFLNKEAYLKIKDNEPRERLSFFEVDATENADASGGEPIFLVDGTPAGRVTSGAYGYSVNKSLAMGFIKEGMATPGDALEIYILGKPHKAVLLAAPAYDPDGISLRS
jgi:dimethylglycine dehydrogenase